MVIGPVAWLLKGKRHDSRRVPRAQPMGEGERGDHSERTASVQGRVTLEMFGRAPSSHARVLGCAGHEAHARADAAGAPWYMAEGDVGAGHGSGQREWAGEAHAAIRTGVHDLSSARWAIQPCGQLKPCRSALSRGRRRRSSLVAAAWTGGQEGRRAAAGRESHRAGAGRRWQAVADMADGAAAEGPSSRAVFEARMRAEGKLLDLRGAFEELLIQEPAFGGLRAPWFAAWPRSAGRRCARRGTAHKQRRARL